MEELSYKKRVRDDSDESVLDSPEVKRLREDLLGNLDDSDLGSASPDLDSFMKSFEEEIAASPRPPVKVTSDYGESQPDLGYLLEASDDELGLPPSTTASTEFDNEVTESGRVSNDLIGISESWFYDQIPSFDSYEFGIGATDDYNNESSGEYVPFDSLFDHSDLGDFSDIWLPAT